MIELVWIGFRALCPREERCLSEKGLRVTSFAALADANETLYERQPAVVVLSLTGTVRDLVGQIAQVRAASPRVFVAVVVRTEVEVDQALRAGADEALSLELGGDRLCYPMLQWADARRRPVGGARVLARRNAYLEARLREVERENVRLVALAAVDEVSGLCARRGLVQHLARVVATRARAALLLVDMPGLGRQVDVLGDFILGGVVLQIGASLTACSRPSDIVARVGPERFAILMPDTDEPAALAVADAIRSTLGRFELPRHGRICATLELSVVMPGTAGAAGDILAAAEARLPDRGHHAAA